MTAYDDPPFVGKAAVLAAVCGVAVGVVTVALGIATATVLRRRLWWR